MSKFQEVEKVGYGKAGYEQFNLFLRKESFSKIFILTDTNSHSSCLSPFLQKIETSIPTEVIEVEAGEEHKNLETCEGIWSALSDLGADRKSLLVNLGGGVITDLGGFVASAFKRGISFVHFPTTLLAMVDAAIGGKNGVNLENLKNQVGIIRQPKMTIIDVSFLETLPPREMRSGLAEMLKHGLIADKKYWHKFHNLNNFDLEDLEGLIKSSVIIKQEIVRQDPEEKNQRKMLNFGHTLGHAIESYMMEKASEEKILHGEAVAAGLILESFLSHKTEGFSTEELEEIREVINSFYSRIALKKEEQKKIMDLLKFDKKNEHGRINFVLLRKIGQPVIDREVSEDLIYAAFEYYFDEQGDT